MHRLLSLRPRLRPYPAAVAVTLATIAAAAAAPAVEGPPPAPVRLAAVVSDEMAPVQWVPGTVASRHQANLSAEVAGALTWVAEVGDRVAEGDVIARLNDAAVLIDLANDDAEIRRLEANLRFLEQRAERTERLAAEQLVAAEEAEQVRSELESAREQVAVARVARERTRYRLDRTGIRAPHSGRIVERLAEPGGYVGVGTPIVRLVDTDHLEVRARAPLSIEPFLREGMTVTVRGRDEEIEALVRTVVAVGDERSRMFELRLDLPDSPWVPGSAVRVSLPTASARPIVAVPRDALVLRSDGIWVFRVGEDDTAERVAVETGVGVGELIEVRGSLRAGDRVVIRGAERLRPGQVVAVEAGTEPTPAGP